MKKILSDHQNIFINSIKNFIKFNKIFKLSKIEADFDMSINNTYEKITIENKIYYKCPKNKVDIFYEEYNKLDFNILIKFYDFLYKKHFCSEIIIKKDYLLIRKKDNLIDLTYLVDNLTIQLFIDYINIKIKLFEEEENLPFIEYSNFEINNFNFDLDTDNFIIGNIEHINVSSYNDINLNSIKTYYTIYRYNIWRIFFNYFLKKEVRFYDLSDLFYMFKYMQELVPTLESFDQYLERLKNNKLFIKISNDKIYFKNIFKPNITIKPPFIYFDYKSLKNLTDFNYNIRFFKYPISEVFSLLPVIVDQDILYPELLLKK